jgi:acyl-CoA reductase-like NAD-dependent aldehyde dehydrogenase
MALLHSHDPATGALVGSVPVTAPAEVSAVVARARAAQPAWAERTLLERAALLRPVGRALRADIPALAELLTREMGKPLADATGEVTACAEGWGETVDEIVEALAPETLRDERTHTTMLFDPLGVCAAITPWNFPMLMPQDSVLPALLAGNTVVLKPSEETPLIAEAWARHVSAVLPPDVLQVIHGDRETGRALVAADVDLIVFTGSRAAGAHILQAAAHGLKRVILELGGKDPLIVLRDADLEAAATFAVRNSFRNAGQVCVSTERIYVDRAVAEPFIDLVCRKTRELTQGPGTEPGIQIGPMISARQKEAVLRQVAAAKAAGARVVVGDEPAPGNFVRPAVVVDVNHSMDLMREETFGPVACIVPVQDADEAVRLANDSPYGLGAAVFGADVANAERVARRIRAGMVGVNRGCGGAKGSPWVGARQSGYGFHSGRAGHRQFAQVRVVSRPIAPPPAPVERAATGG